MEATPRRAAPTWHNDDMRRLLSATTLLVSLVACEPGSPSPPPVDAYENAVAACAAFVACDFSWPDLGWCVESVLGDALPSLSPRADDVGCIAAAHGDCDAIRACIGWSAVPAGGACSGRCDGETLVVCLGGDENRIDCPHTAPGNTCVTYPPAPGDTRAPAHACTSPECPAYGGSSCFGDDVASCGIESYRTLELCPEGTGCALYPDPSGTVSYYGCVGLGATCTEARCDGTVSRPCVQGREALPFDCAERGLACVRGFCDFYDPSVLCHGGSTEHTCEGDVLVYCNSGRTTRVDCRSLGFASCEPVFSSSFRTASCAPAGGRRTRPPGP